MWGCKICIQAGTFQESLDHWCKNNYYRMKSFMSGSDEKLNQQNTAYRYSEPLLTAIELIYPHDKYYAFESMCDGSEKDIKLTKWSYVLNGCSECTAVFP